MSGKLFSAAKMSILMVILLQIWIILDVSCPLISLLPPAWQTWLADFHVPELSPKEKSLSEDFASFVPVTTLYGSQSEEDILKIIKKHPFETVLIKGFLSADLAADILEKVKTMTAQKNYSLVKGSYASHQRLGGLFGQGIVDGNPWEDFKKGRRRQFESDLSGIWNGSAQDIYGAFVPVGEGSMHKLVNWTSRKFTPDTSFFGWFSKKAVTTPLHANWPADTFGLQLAGRKQWVVIDPFDMKRTLLKQKCSLHSGGQGGVFYPNLRVDANLQAVMKLANAEPGDLLYFPPYAAHAVVSDAGLNVMTALRFPNPRKAFNVHPWKTLEAGLYWAANSAYQAVRFKFGLNKYAAHFDITKYTSLTVGVQLKTWSPVYDDLQLEKLLDETKSRECSGDGICASTVS